MVSISPSILSADNIANKNSSPKAAEGTLNKKPVRKIDQNPLTCSKVALKVVAVALIIVGIAATAAALAFGFSMLFAGNILVLDAIVTPLAAALGTPWAIVAASVAGAIGIAKLVSGILLWKKSSMTFQDELIERRGVKVKIDDYKIKEGSRLELYDSGLFEVPASVANFPNLNLYIDNNFIRDLTPSMPHIVNLASLSITRNRLHTLPKEIEEMKNVISLKFDENKLKELPDELCNLSTLETLKIAINKLESLPKNIGALKNLRTLDLRHNKLTELPESIGELSELEELLLDGNEITKLPESIGKLTKLKKLSLIDNKLETLPASLSKLSNLTHINIRYNDIKKLPADVLTDKNFPNLEFFVVDEEDVAKLPNIDKVKTDPKWNRVDFSQAEISFSHKEIGTLPEQIIKMMKNVRVLHLHNARLQSLPENIGTLTELRELNVSGNFITELPKSIGKLKNLTTLNLRNNEITTLPKSLSKLTNLKYLYLNGTLIDKEVPSEISDKRMKSLIHVDVDGDKWKFLPEIHPLIKNGPLQQLEQHTHPVAEHDPYGVTTNGARLASCHLSRLPSCVCQMWQVHKLHLANNYLNELPEEIGDIRNLTHLDLRNNPLKTLPASLSKLKNLKYLYLDGTVLESIPKEINSKNLPSLKCIQVNSDDHKKLFKGKFPKKVLEYIPGPYDKPEYN